MHFHMPDDPLESGNLAAMEQCVCFNLRWVTRLITQHFDHRLRAAGLRPNQMSILAGLAARPSATMAEMADWLGMERTTLLRNLGPLVREGWVEMSPGARPRSKAQQLQLTPSGRRKLLEIHPAWEEAQRSIVATLGGQRWSELLADLERATERLAGGKVDREDNRAYAHTEFRVEFD